MAHAFLVQSTAPDKLKVGDAICFGLALDATLEQAQALVDGKFGPSMYRVSQPPSGSAFAVQKVETVDIGDAQLDAGAENDSDIDGGDIEVVQG